MNVVSQVEEGVEDCSNAAEHRDLPQQKSEPPEDGMVAAGSFSTSEAPLQCPMPRNAARVHHHVERYCIVEGHDVVDPCVPAKSNTDFRVSSLFLGRL